MKNWKDEIDKAHKKQSGFFKQIEMKEAIKKTRNTTEIEQSSMEFLNIIRDLKQINIFASIPNLMSEMGIDRNEATRIVRLWMWNFNEEGNYKTVNKSTKTNR